MKVQIHSAPWVLPITQPPIRDGAVVVFERRIVDVGKLKDIRLKYPGHVHIDHPDAILMPALVNAHCHLELSPLKWRLSPTGSITAWIESLVKARASIAPEEWVPAIKDAIDELVRGGVLIVGDIGNTGLVPSIMMENTEEWLLEGVHFLEIIQPEEPSNPSTDELMGEDHSLFKRPYPMPVTISAHGVHTVHAALLKAIKAKTREKSLPFTLHVAESPEEIQYLQAGTGPMLDLLKQHGRDPARLKVPSKRPVAFLDDLGLLDEMTLLVHCVHIEGDELDIIEKKGASICLCPRSNTFLGVGTPPIDEILTHNINCAIGTDSLASNDRLDLFSEMTALARLSPHISPSRIIEMATLGGAKALGLSNRFGSLEPNKASLFLEVTPPSLPKSPQDLEEIIVGAGARDAFEIDVVR